MKSLKSTNLKLSFSFSPVTKWILTILILGVGVVLVLVLYAQQQTRNSDLKEEVNQASSALVENSLQRRASEEKLAVANLTLAELAVQFPSAKQSMDVEDALFSAAADSGLTVVSINCPEPRAETVNKSTYQAFKVTVSVEGSTEDFLRFVGRLGYWLPSASIEAVTVSDGLTVVLDVYAGVGE
ncbi:MAG: hypothetical protein JW753_05760 [Dehalococcoidia bacterium]|nr:hypothetical protein [Dehalococcoidia bacterium]